MKILMDENVEFWEETDRLSSEKGFGVLVDHPRARDMIKISQDILSRLGY
jgi:hypothetical protein